MKPSLIALVCTAALTAQDVEPSLGRAAAAAAREIAQELPWRLPAAGVLEILAADAGSRAAARLTADALRREGFNVVVDAAPGGNDAVEVVVGVSGGGDRRTLTVVVEAAHLKTARGFGGAAWVDDPAERGRVIEGPERGSADEAVAAAKAELRRVREARFPSVAQSRRYRHQLDVEPAAVFTASRGRGPERTFRAYVRDGADDVRLAAFDAAAASRFARAPFIKTAAAVIAALALLTLFKFCDWFTRGWRTRTLRLVFGGLFAAVVVGLWGVPL